MKKCRKNGQANTTGSIMTMEIATWTEAGAVVSVRVVIPVEPVPVVPVSVDVRPTQAHSRHRSEQSPELATQTRALRKEPYRPMVEKMFMAVRTGAYTGRTTWANMASALVLLTLVVLRSDGSGCKISVVLVSKHRHLNKSSVSGESPTTPQTGCAV